MHGACLRCGGAAEVLHQRRFGALVPSCRRCTRRPFDLHEAAASLGAPVRFTGTPPPPSSRARRLALRRAAGAGAPRCAWSRQPALAVAWTSAVPLMVVQLVLLAWLVATPWTFTRLSGVLHVRGAEATRLEHRWGRFVAAVVVVCDFTVAVLALSQFSAY